MGGPAVEICLIFSHGWFMDFGEEDHIGKVPFSSYHIKGIHH